MLRDIIVLMIVSIEGNIIITNASGEDLMLRP